METDFFNKYASATVIGTNNNNIMDFSSPSVRTYRSYYKLREYGSLNLRFWYSNIVDTTGCSIANLPGAEFEILGAGAADGGTEPDGSVASGTFREITFGGERAKHVSPCENFWSDEVSIEIPEGHFLAFTWTIAVPEPCLACPYSHESRNSSFVKEGNFYNQDSPGGFTYTDDSVKPNFIGYRKDIKKKIVFLGDSITQGVRTPVDKYEFWAARIAEGLPRDYSVWNLGLGWSKASDAASGGIWLKKASVADEIIICLGVNDINRGDDADTVFGNISKTVELLKTRNPKMKVILFTVPTYNYTGAQEVVWREVNARIKANPPRGTDRVFDITKAISQDPPRDNFSIPEYNAAPGDSHLNSLAGKAVAESFLSWYMSDI